MTKPEIITLGCRLNRHESEIIREHLREAGLERALVVNGCAVTGEAVRQTRQAVRRLRREHPNALLVVTGCAAQLESAMFDGMEEVDHVLGNHEKLRGESWHDLEAGRLERVRVGDIFAPAPASSSSGADDQRPLISGFGGRARAYVEIQSGCDHRCTFCIIPFGRGPSRSLPSPLILEQVSRLCAEGFAEIVLTGVDIASWGRDLEGNPRLGGLCAMLLAKEPRLKRLRISSIDLLDDDQELMELIGGEERFMPHLHLSLQSGDDLILKRMKRRHSASQAVEFCHRLRELRPGLALGADLIAGFPTESEEMHANSLRHIDQCQISFLHVFPFSPRKGTPAARLPRIRGDIVRRRARQLREKGSERLEQFLAGRHDRVEKVLVERGREGRSEHFAAVRLNREARPGEIVMARICGHDREKGCLHGEIICAAKS